MENAPTKKCNILENEEKDSSNHLLFTCVIKMEEYYFTMQNNRNSEVPIYNKGNNFGVTALSSLFDQDFSDNLFKLYKFQYKRLHFPAYISNPYPNAESIGKTTMLSKKGTKTMWQHDQEDLCTILMSLMTLLQRTSYEITID